MLLTDFGAAAMLIVYVDLSDFLFNNAKLINGIQNSPSSKMQTLTCLQTVNGKPLCYEKRGILNFQ